MAAGSESGASNLLAPSNVMEMLAAKDSENARQDVLRKHDTIKDKTEQPKKERAEQAKKRELLSAALKNAKRAKSRITHRASKLSQDDTVAMLCYKQEKEITKSERKANPGQKASGSKKKADDE